MQSLIVKVKQGKLRGCIVKNVLGGTYFSFKGIPYAAPPIGDLRFKDPAPPIRWTGVRDASKYAGEIAPQTSPFNPNKIQGGEDCLYLSVHTPSLDKLRPVMVWIHDGSFIWGSERSVQPDYLVAKDVLVVTLSYRLGILGFLNLGHEIVSGNQGIKDQAAALQWVNENIENFGGNPNNITVYGASAGAGIVHLLAMSPISRRLFHKAILQSSTAGCIWGLYDNGPKRCFRVAKNLGVYSEDPVKVFDYLQSLPVTTLVKAQSETLTSEEKRLKYLEYGPTLKDVARNPIFPQPNSNYQKNADSMPMLIGYTSHETAISNVPDSSEMAPQTLDKLLYCYILKTMPHIDSREIEVLLRELQNYYFTGEINAVDRCHRFLQIFGDIHFANPVKHLGDVRRHDKCAPTYLYRFSYVGDQMTISRRTLHKSVIKGAAHLDDLAYIWHDSWSKRNNVDPPLIGTKDRITLERLTRMWTNFAKTGNPTSSLDEYVSVPWRPVKSHDFNYLNIGDELQNLSLKDDVWQIYRKYITNDKNSIQACLQKASL